MAFGIKTYITRRFLVPRNKLVVLTLHQSTDEFDPAHHCEYTWTKRDELESNLAHLKEKYQIIPLMQGVEALSAGTLTGTRVAVTFDDGDRSVASHIVPLLEKLNIPATFFINTAYLDQSGKGYWFNIYNYLKNCKIKSQTNFTPENEKTLRTIRNTSDPREYDNLRHTFEDLAEYLDDGFRPYLTMTDLKNMNNELFSIGMHGNEHQRFSMMKREWKEKDLRLNYQILSELPGFIPVFALPFGKMIDYDHETRKICDSMGLHVALSENGYNVGGGSEILRIPADGRNFKMIFDQLQPLSRKK